MSFLPVPIKMLFRPQESGSVAHTLIKVPSEINIGPIVCEVKTGHTNS